MSKINYLIIPNSNTITGTANDDILNGTAGIDKIYGLDGNDTLNGLSGNDVLEGGNGNDALNGADGGDTLHGLSGNDTMSGGSGDDALEGGDGKDVITGDDGSDVLYGGAGNDTLAGGAGLDVIDGGDGEDTAVYNLPFASATIYGVASATGKKITVFSVDGAEQLSGIEKIQFSDKTILTNDYLTEFQVNTYTTDDQLASATTTLVDGGFVICWQSHNQDGSDWGAYGQRYAADGSLEGKEFLINSQIDRDQSDLAVTALADGGFVIAWDSFNQDAVNTWGVYAQRYTANGKASGSEFRVNTYINGDQVYPSLTGLNDGGFVATWQSFGFDGRDIYGQRFSADSSKLGDEFRINTVTSNDQVQPTITALVDGGFVVTWSAGWGDGNGMSIAGQRYGSNGLKIGDEFRINTYTVEDQGGYNPEQRAQITALYDGGFVVFWDSHGQDGDNWGIYAQRFDAAGKPKGNEFQVNTYTIGAQTDPAVTTLADGGFVVTWSSTSQDSWLLGQRYDANAVAVGSEFRIQANANRSNVTALTDGGFMVTWDANGQDGDGYGVYGQRFDVNGQRIALLQTNHLPTGEVLISGTAQEAQILTASNTLTDADGLGKISYQWQANGTVLGDGSTYLVKASDVGKTISVTASYTDGKGTPEHVDSITTHNVLPLADAGVSITDNDYATSENGDTATFKVFLNAPPVHDVSLNFTSTDLTEGVINQPELIFTSANWSTPQDLIISGVDDSIVDGAIIYTITGSISTLDVQYSSPAVTIPQLSMSNANDDDIIYGDVGGAKIDVLNGGSGEDLLYGKDMNDDLSGGTGNDTLWGGYGNDVLSGNEGNDLLNGEQDNDHLDGGAGNDTLDGGLGADTMIGGTGSDTYYLGYDAKDVIDDQGLSSDIDTVIMPYQLSQYTLPEGIENGSITQGTGTGNLTGNDSNNSLIGNDGKNTLNGDVGRDSLFGGGGADTLIGGADSDTIDGGTGNDLIVGGNGLGDDNYTGGAGNDTVKYTSATKPISVDLMTGKASGDEIGTDKLSGIENVIAGQSDDNVNGNASNNRLEGFNGNDTLNGGAGNDSLVGNIGVDLLFGGLGADLFIFTSETESGITALTRDTIQDFKHGDGDKIDLSGIDANTVLAVNNAFTAPTIGSAFTGTFSHAGQLYFDTTTHILYGNNDADNSEDFSILLIGVTSLVATDFKL